MKNCIILGCGRSGTSLVAGIISSTGCFMGNELMSPTKDNPKGYFESYDVQRINEDIIAQVIKPRPRSKLLEFIFRNRPVYGQRWLARIPVGTQFPSLPEIELRIEELIPNDRSFCLKDPRFSYTLPVWRPFLQNTAYICVFRDPATTATSIMKFRQNVSLSDLRINFRDALDVWRLIYEHILQLHSKKGKWLFLHYEQALISEGLDRIEKFIETPVEKNFPDPSLRRSFSSRSVSREIGNAYQKLCELAGYEDLNH